MAGPRVLEQSGDDGLVGGKPRHAVTPGSWLKPREMVMVLEGLGLGRSWCEFAPKEAHDKTQRRRLGPGTRHFTRRPDLPHPVTGDSRNIGPHEFVAQRDVDAELFTQLAAQALDHGLSGFDLAARELPQAARPRGLGAAGSEQQAGRGKRVGERTGHNQ